MKHIARRSREGKRVRESPNSGRLQHCYLASPSRSCIPAAHRRGGRRERRTRRRDRTPVDALAGRAPQSAGKRGTRAGEKQDRTLSQRHARGASYLDGRVVLFQHQAHWLLNDGVDELPRTPSFRSLLPVFRSAAERMHPPGQVPLLEGAALERCGDSELRAQKR